MDGATINGQQIKVNEVSNVFKCLQIYMLYMNRLVPVVMEAVAAAVDVAVEDMVEAAVAVDMEVVAMEAAVAVEDTEVSFHPASVSFLFHTMSSWEWLEKRIYLDRYRILSKPE